MRYSINVIKADTTARHSLSDAEYFPPPGEEIGTRIQPARFSIWMGLEERTFDAIVDGVAVS